MFENVKKLLDISVNMGTPALDVSVFHNGKEVFSERRGCFDEEGTPLSGDELYNIYSCSKFITCAAALKLYEEGKFSLEDDVADYIPAFGDMRVIKNGGIYKAENRIKIKNLFTMTTGMRYDTKAEEIKEGREMTDGKCPTVEMMKYLAKMPLEFEPGERWRYSFSHDVIAALVETVSGKRFGEYVKEVIFDPLGMSDTTYLLPDEKLDRICAQYRFDKNENKYINVGKLIQNYKLGSEYESGGAGAVSTVKDYMKFLEAIRTGRIISEQTLAAMQRNYLRAEQFGCYWGAHRYGYGLGVRVPLGDGKRTDFGWGGAAGAFCAVDTINNITVYYSQHVLSSPFSTVRKDLIEAAKLDLGYEAFVEDMYNGEGNTLA